MKEIVYTSNKNMRLDVFLQSKYPLLKSGTVNKFLRQNKIKINGSKQEASTRLCKNDKISLYVEDTYLELPTKESAFKFSGKALEIVYEDDNLLIVNKPCGIAVIDNSWENFDTLVNRVSNNYFLNDKAVEFPLQPCHRIDTGTQGLVVFAKNQNALDFMTDAFKNKLLEKIYVCICKGVLPNKPVVEKAFLNKNAKEGYVTVTSEKRGEFSKPIETHIKPISSYRTYTLLEIKLITGRTHQIRAHLAYLNLPILGDSRYGDNDSNRKLKLKYQLLCSYKIKFSSIENSDFKYLSDMEFKCPPPWFIDSFYNKEF